MIVISCVFLVQICARHWLMSLSSLLFFTFFDWFKLLFTGKTSGSITIPESFINWLLKNCKIDISSFNRIGQIQLQSIDCNFSIYDILLWLSGKLPNRPIRIAFKQFTIDVDFYFIFSNGDEMKSSVKIQLNQVHLLLDQLGNNQNWDGVVTVGYVNISSPQSSFVKDKTTTRACDSVIRIFGLKMPFGFFQRSSKSISSSNDWSISSNFLVF